MDENLIDSNPAVMMENPYKGTRITVELILEKMAAERALSRF